MKNVLCILFSIFLFLSHSKAQEIEATSTITDVTVYRNLAKETRSSTVTIPAGNSDIVLSGASLQMIDQSIQVSVKGEATLLSATIRINYFNETIDLTTDSKASKLLDSVNVLEIELRWIGEERILYNGELSVINDLIKSVTTQKDYKPVDLNACADIYRLRTTELKKKLFDLSLKEEAIQRRKTKHQGQLNEMGASKQSPVKEIVLSFWSETSVSSQLKCSYLVNTAGWVPMYDLSVENTSKPVALSYKARIFQNTGMNWKNVNLKISTATPSQNNNRPIMSPRYMDYVNYRLDQTNAGSATNSMYIAERFDDAVSDPYNYEVTVNESEIQVEYEIDIKQTIPSDGKQHVCKLQNYNIPATYKYHAVPKLDASAFLLARITDYGQYNFLPGQANIFFGDTYVGQVDINPQVIGDTLLVSLGRDEKIVIKRTRVKEKMNKKILSGIQKDTYAYEITVRNNKSSAIEIEILDQVPLSRRNEITVKLLEKGNANYDKDYGKLLWNLKVGPNASKTFDLEYTVEYPEGQVVGEQ